MTQSVEQEDFVKAKRAFEKKFDHLNKFVLESVTDIVGIANNKGNTIYISPSIDVLAGYKPKELLERNGAEFAHPDDLDLIASELKKLPKKKEVRFEYRLRKKDGIYIWVETVIRLVDLNDDGTEYMVFVSRDIEKRKQLETQIQKTADELAQLNGMKDKLIYLIAHDLTNPIYNVISLTEYLKKKLPQISYEELVEFIARINESANSSYVLLENLLEWARVHNGMVEFKPEQVKILRTINDNWNLVKVQATAKSLNFVCDIPKDLSFQADLHMFDIIVRNLLSNAVKFTPEHGTIEIDSISSGAEVVIRFRDTGIGMSREQQRYLFQADSRKQLNSMTTGHGSGLGLVLCKELIGKHNGRISVVSGIGKGTTITLHFPAIRAN